MKEDPAIEDIKTLRDNIKKLLDANERTRGFAFFLLVHDEDGQFEVGYGCIGCAVERLLTYVEENEDKIRHNRDEDEERFDRHNNN